MTEITPVKAGIKYGTYMGVALIIIGLVSYLAGFYDMPDCKPNVLTQWLPWVVMVGGTVLAVLYFKKENEGYLSVGQGVGTGAMAGLINGLIGLVWVIVFYKFIGTEVLETLSNCEIQKLEDQGMSDEQIDAAKKMIDMFMSPVVMGIMMVIMGVLASTIVSLITSLVVKNNRAD